MTINNTGIINKDPSSNPSPILFRCSWGEMSSLGTSELLLLHNPSGMGMLQDLKEDLENIVRERDLWNRVLNLSI